MYCLIFVSVLIFAAEKKEPAPRTPVAQVRVQSRSFMPTQGLATQAEGYALALLGSCTVGGRNSEGKKNWETALKWDHLHIRFPKPRFLSVTVDLKSVEVSEILVAFPGVEGAASASAHVLARKGDVYYGFTKYSFDDWKCVRRFLDRLVEGRTAVDRDKAKRGR